MTTVSSSSLSAAASNAYYLAHGGEFLNSVQTTGNWMLDVANSDTTSWLDPNSNGPDIVDLAANAFAQAQTATANTATNLVLTQAQSVLQQQLNALQSGTGQFVNLLA